MAERKGPGSGKGENEGEHFGSGQRDDQVRFSDQRDVPVSGKPDEDSELSENLQGPPAEPTDVGAARPDDRVFSDIEPPDAAGSGSAQVLNFPETGEGDGRDDDTASEFGHDAIDLSALREDDALLDSLGGADPDIRFGSQQPGLEALLVAWRHDVDSTPIGDLVDVDAAASAIDAGRRPRLRKRRHLVPVATAAAVLMITFTGVGLAARDAMPGDALWGVAQVLYADHARSAQAATDAQAELLSAGVALDQGRRAAAEAALKRAHEQMQTVEPDHGLRTLQASYASLTKKFQRSEEPTESSSVNATSPPLTSEPVRPTSPSQGPGPVPPPSSTTGQPTSTSPTPPETSTTAPSSGTSQPSWNSPGGLWPAPQSSSSN